MVWLTRDWSELLKIPAPPEAKLTPVRNDALFLFDLTARYGGEDGNPTFSADIKKKKGLLKHASTQNVKPYVIIYTFATPL